MNNKIYLQQQMEIIIYFLLLLCFHYESQDETINYSLLTYCHDVENIIYHHYAYSLL